MIAESMLTIKNQLYLLTFEKYDLFTRTGDENIMRYTMKEIYLMKSRYEGLATVIEKIIKYKHVLGIH